MNPSFSPSSGIVSPELSSSLSTSPSRHLLADDEDGPSTTSAPFTSYEVRTLETEDFEVSLGRSPPDVDSVEIDPTTSHGGDNSPGSRISEVSTPFLSLASLRASPDSLRSTPSVKRGGSIGKRSRFVRRPFRPHLFAGVDPDSSHETDYLLDTPLHRSGTSYATAPTSTTWYKVCSIVFLLLVGIVLLILLMSVIRRVYFSTPYVYVRSVEWNIPNGPPTSHLEYTLKISVRNLNYRSLDVSGLDRVSVNVVDPKGLVVYNLSALHSDGHWEFGCNSTMSPKNPVALRRVSSDVDIRIVGSLQRYSSKELQRIHDLLKYGQGLVLVTGVLKVGYASVEFEKHQLLVNTSDDGQRKWWRARRKTDDDFAAFLEKSPQFPFSSAHRVIPEYFSRMLLLLLPLIFLSLVPSPSRAVVTDFHGLAYLDTIETGCDDCSYCTDITGMGFRYYGIDVTQFCVSTNGLVSFVSQLSSYNPTFPTSQPIIAVWWADGSLSYSCGTDCNELRHRVSTAPADLAHFKAQLQEPLDPTFDPDVVAVATWLDVGYYDGGGGDGLDMLNDYQVVLLAEAASHRTVVILNYQEVLWRTGEAGVGFGGWNVNQSYEFPGVSRSGRDSAGRQLVREHSCAWGDPGRYVARIDQDPVEADWCDCVTGVYEFDGRCAKFMCDTVNFCSDLGRCVAPQTCACIGGHYGPDCTQIYVCPSNCSGHGVCTGVNPDKCYCDPEWGGNLCEMPYCVADPDDWPLEYVIANDSRVCNRHGVCVDRHTCACPGQWVGEDCTEKAMCGPYLYFDSPAVCSGRGTCVTTDTCACFWGYAGAECSVPACWNVSSESEEVCSRNGVCFQSDACFCYRGFYGRACSEFVADDAIVLTRFTNEDPFNFFIAHVVEKKDVKPEQAPAGVVVFNCSSLLHAESPTLFPPDATCSWVIDLENFIMTEGINVTIPDPNRYPTWASSGHFALHFAPVTAATKYEFFELDFILVVKSPGLSAYQIVAIAAGGLLIPICLVCLTICIVAVCCCLTQHQKAKLDQFGQLDNFDIVLQEQQAEKSTGVDKIRVNKEFSSIPYEDVILEATIGVGGSGATVYRARWEGATVAFKVFRMTQMREKSMMEMFQREVSICMSVRHPNVLRIYGSSVKIPRLGIVMEYCQYGELRQFFRRCSLRNILLSMATKLRMVFEIASAVVFLHRNSIIHRDMKCENVLIDDQLTCRVIDFGLSRLIESKESLARLTKQVGTSYYMAPEVVLGESYTGKCDVFSMGIMIWEIIACDFEPYGETLDSIEMRVAMDPTLRPAYWSSSIMSEVRANHVENIIPLMRDCWEHKADDRPTSEQVVEELRILCECCDEEELEGFVIHDDGEKVIAVPSISSKSGRQISQHPHLRRVPSIHHLRSSDGSRSGSRSGSGSGTRARSAGGTPPRVPVARRPKPEPEPEKVVSEEAQLRQRIAELARQVQLKKKSEAQLQAKVGSLQTELQTLQEQERQEAEYAQYYAQQAAAGVQHDPQAYWQQQQEQLNQGGYHG